MHDKFKELNPLIRISSDKKIYAFSESMTPVAQAKPGDVVLFETNDCFGGQIPDEGTLCTEIDFNYINPATGPLEVIGAERGDLLGVTIQSIEFNGPSITVAVPGEGFLPDKVDASLTRVSSRDEARKVVTFRGIDVPARPMIGVIGVATDEGNGAIATGTPWTHGGNMDTIDIAPGATLWLPVFQRGAMLAMGDCHAAMGDGEVCCSGAETAAQVTVRLDLAKGAAFDWPLLVTKEAVEVIVSGDSLDQAAQGATDAMVGLAARALGLEWKDALILCSLAMDLRVCQVVDPRKTMRASMPLSVLPWEKVRRGRSTSH